MAFMKKHLLLGIMGILIVLVIVNSSLAAKPDWVKDKDGTTEPEVIIINNTATGENVKASSINWEMIAVILAVLGGIIGWLISRKVRGKTAKYMTEIDKVYRNHNKNTSKCEAELASLKEQIEDDFKKGKINDQSLALLDSRIDKYSKELRTDIVSKKFSDLPDDMTKTVKHMLKDGVITKEEYDHFAESLKSSKMSSKDKAELSNLMKKWKKEDKR